jgi:hypothetical protein
MYAAVGRSVLKFSTSVVRAISSIRIYLGTHNGDSVTSFRALVPESVTWVRLIFR